jgi:sulfur transfer protein SufE
VHGVATLLCDIFSGKSAAECDAITDTDINQLGIEPLLSLNRRQAVRKVLNFIRATVNSSVCLR